VISLKIDFVCFWMRPVGRPRRAAQGGSRTKTHWRTHAATRSDDRGRDPLSLGLELNALREQNLISPSMNPDLIAGAWCGRDFPYRGDWKDFCRWCEARELCPLPASGETVASYIAEYGRLKVGSLQRRLNAIAEAHKAVGLEPPTSAGIVRNTLKGIKRTMGTATVQKAAALTDDIRAMVAVSDSGPIGARDRALVLLGFAGAFRRSELVALDVEDCAFLKEGLAITLRRSKTDQDGAGRKVGIPYGSNPETCPVRVLQDWLEQAAFSSGPLFRSLNRHGQVQAGRLSGIDVARVVKNSRSVLEWMRPSTVAIPYVPHTLRRRQSVARRKGRS
jgi:site-specific recombinase XerC